MTDTKAKEKLWTVKVRNKEYLFVTKNAGYRESFADALARLIAEARS